MQKASSCKTHPCAAWPRNGFTRRLHPALLALGALVLAPGVGVADEQPVTGQSQAGYPRTSDEPPAGPDAAQDGDGDENSAGGTTYDTNWILDGSSGDSDIVWLKVRKACIQGYGQVEDADRDSATSRSKQAWGEDRVHFDVAATESDDVTITVTNRIRINGSWILNGNGRNSAVLKAQALDINGTVHTVDRTLTVDPASTATSSDRTSETDGSSASTTVGGGTGGTGASATDNDSSSSESEHQESDTVTTSDGISGSVDVAWNPVRQFTGKSCDVKVGSTETIDIQAQAVIDGVQTTVKIAYFDTVNYVEASYVIDTGDGAGSPGGSDPPPGPGSPGGSDPSGPETPSGGDGDGGTGPETPGGGTPPGGETPGGGEPEEPEPDDEDEPTPVPSGDGSTLPAPAGSGPESVPEDEPAAGQDPTPVQ